MSRFFATVSLLVLVSLSSGCAFNIPHASPERDQEAKAFQPQPGKANLYVYRSEFIGAAFAMDVSLDGEKMGSTGAQDYLFAQVAPGKHTVTSHAENDDTIKFTAEAGKNHFIWQEVKLGVLKARTKLHLVGEDEGRTEVGKCQLVDTAAQLAESK